MALMTSSRAKYAIASILILVVVTASIFASDIVQSINIITSPAPTPSQNLTTPIPAPVFPEVSQSAKSVRVDLKELKSTYRPPKTAIKVGIVVYGSDSDPIARTMRSVLSQWVSEVNQNGGIFLNSQQKKIPVQVVIYQDSDLENLGRAYHETLALQDKVDLAIVVGGPSSASQAIQVFDENQVFHIALSNIQNDAMVRTNNYTVLLGGGTSSNVGADFGRFAKSLDIKSVAIIRSDDYYYRNVSSAIKRSLQLEGIQVIIDDSTTLSGSFFVNGIQNIRQRRPDAVIILGPPSLELRFLSTLRQNLVSIPLVFTDLAAQSPGRVTNTMGRDADGLVGYSSWISSPEFRRNVNFGPSNEELSRISSVYGNSPQAAQVYTAAKILQRIAEEAESVDAKEMRTVALKYQSSMTALGPFFIGTDGLMYSNVQVVAQVRRASDGSISYEIMWPLEYKTSGALYPIPNRFSRP
jgi:ABC-type branched-subunit amino acid transport system substrate-binding protein